MTTYSIVGPDSSALEAALGDLDAARRQLADAELEGPELHRLRHEVLAFCDRHDDALWRSCLDGHLTGSALVVDPATGRSLLIHHAKLDRWLQPGGHADGDGNLGAVAWREASEETGLIGLSLVTPAIDLDVHTIPARGDEPEHLHLDLRFLVLAGPSVEAAPNHETLGARWMEPADLEPGTELARAVVRAVEVAAVVTSGRPAS